MPLPKTLVNLTADCAATLTLISVSLGQGWGACVGHAGPKSWIRVVLINLVPVLAN